MVLLHGFNKNNNIQYSLVLRDFLRSTVSDFLNSTILLVTILVMLIKNVHVVFKILIKLIGTKLIIL